MKGLFSFPQKAIDRVERHVVGAVRPASRLLTEAIQNLEENSIAEIPFELVRLPLEALVREPYGDLLDPSPAQIAALRLRLTSCLDKGSDKAWIKKSYLWTRMLEVAGDETEIGYKEVAEPVDKFFHLAALGQVPFRTFEGVGLLMCGIGPKSRLALQEVLAVEKNFDPRQWDGDGYFVAPSPSPGISDP